MILTFIIFVVSLVTAELAAVHQSSLAESFSSHISWAPNCPSGSGKIPRLIPHPYDCRTMFLCSDGMPEEYLCPNDQVFSPESQECLKRTTCKTGMAKEWPAFESCPEDGRPHYFKHPEDCSMFYQCGPLGVAFPKRCPGKLYFNPKVSVCDWPRNVDCKSRFFVRRSRQVISEEKEI